ncbi:hypothetical protein [Photobacterium kasasachensis]|uniref:hypothetical protein n=1 Tax=Photobacterium kasasachensis TaxID=2910240 RepID=UPI003D143463
MKGYNLEAKFSEAVKFVAFSTLLVPILVGGILLLEGISFVYLLENGTLLDSAFFTFLFTSVITLLIRSRVLFLSEGIYRKGFNKYGFKDVIPWTAVRELSLVNIRSMNYLKLGVAYPRDFYSNNGSKEIDVAIVFISVSFCGFCNDEILTMAKKFKNIS